MHDLVNSCLFFGWKVEEGYFRTINYHVFPYSKRKGNMLRKLIKNCLMCIEELRRKCWNGFPTRILNRSIFFFFFVEKEKNFEVDWKR